MRSQKSNLCSQYSARQKKIKETQSLKSFYFKNKILHYYLIQRRAEGECIPLYNSIDKVILPPKTAKGV